MSISIETNASKVEADFARVAAIEAEVAKLTAEKRAIIDRYVAHGSPAGLMPPTHFAPATDARGPSRGIRPGSFSSMVLAFLDEHPGEAFSIAQIFEETGAGKNKGALRTALSDLLKRKKLSRVSEGMYQAIGKESTA